ncbi:MAG: GspH/FimT family pseudopilin [Gammaproteobacteria bacterium]
MTAQQAGFTLIELMIVIVVLAIFVTVGVPNFQNLIRENRLATQANEFVSSLHFARSEAIKRRLQVALCRTTDGATCVAGGTPSWETGWLVFVDDVTSNGSIDAGEQLLRSVSAKPTSTLRSTNANTNDTVLFRNNGLLTNPGGSFNLCDSNTADTASGRRIRINVTGQVVTEIGNAFVASCP